MEAVLWADMVFLQLVEHLKMTPQEKCISLTDIAPDDAPYTELFISDKIKENMQRSTTYWNSGVESPTFFGHWGPNFQVCHLSRSTFMLTLKAMVGNLRNNFLKKFNGMFFKVTAIDDIFYHV